MYLQCGKPLCLCFDKSVFRCRNAWIVGREQYLTQDCALNTSQQERSFGISNGALCPYPITPNNAVTLATQSIHNHSRQHECGTLWYCTVRYLYHTALINHITFLVQGSIIVSQKYGNKICLNVILYYFVLLFIVLYLTFGKFTHLYLRETHFLVIYFSCIFLFIHLSYLYLTFLYDKIRLT